jgi:hypothetical protein
MAPAPPVSSLPSSHPLIAELTSLRQQLAQYQKSGHQSAIQLQGARLELNLAKEETAVLRETNDTLRSEITVLRYVTTHIPYSKPEPLRVVTDSQNSSPSTDPTTNLHSPSRTNPSPPPPLYKARSDGTISPELPIRVGEL